MILENHRPDEPAPWSQNVAAEEIQDLEGFFADECSATSYSSAA
ncbi:MAG: hypothetical protein PHZ09_14820 [Eubacteriales bacterium]|nr:hypothetical protein [Eubacteriales bacterium]